MSQGINNNHISILLVEDSPDDVFLFRKMLAEENTGQFELTHCNMLSSALTLLGKRNFGIILLDLSLPDGNGLDTVARTHTAAPNAPIVVMSGSDDEELAVRALQEGAQDYLVKGQVDRDLLIRSMRYSIERKHAEDTLQIAHDKLELRVQERTENLIEANQKLLREIAERKKAEESLLETLKEIERLKAKLHEENIYLREEIGQIHPHKDIVGNSEAIRTVLMQMEQVAETESTVLIQGETGTGKELVANAIHGMSSRKDRIMIKVNCGALPPTLIESELFGREKGAFTGSLSKQIGRFELADASTIFLDEIDALPLELQAKLLRVVECGEFERLGSPMTVKVDIRIISATNRDLAKLVSEGGFREDLYYRLNVFQIVVPPLRKRREDILPLVWSFIHELSKRMGKRIESIPQESIEALKAYPWPGNVRELRNITERAMILTTGPVLHLEVPKIKQSDADQGGTLEEAEKRHILGALDTAGWRVSGKGGAAEILGINPKTLESKIKRLGIQRNKPCQRPMFSNGPGRMPDISGVS
ncbi:MAG TPA: sigma-54 dependent transcriptional regulator [Thermodesulfovibrionales bacterium]|nr:sigma-54 dependent transcriptional regulator [Thermodesulfovibrionales bacterium]